MSRRINNIKDALQARISNNRDTLSRVHGSDASRLRKEIEDSLKSLKDLGRISTTNITAEDDKRIVKIKRAENKRLKKDALRALESSEQWWKKDTAILLEAFPEWNSILNKLHDMGDYVFVNEGDRLRAVATPINMEKPDGAHMILARYDFMFEMSRRAGDTRWDVQYACEAGEFFFFVDKTSDKVYVFQIVEVMPAVGNRRDHWTIVEHANRKVVKLSEPLGFTSWSNWAKYARCYAQGTSVHYLTAPANGGNDGD